MPARSFFTPARTVTAAEIAELHGARLLDRRHADAVIRGLASLDAAAPGDLAFADGRRQIAAVQALRATAILCTEDVAPDVPTGIAVLATRSPQRAFAAVGRLLYPQSVTPEPMTRRFGVLPGAHVDPSAVIEPGATVEPGAVIGPGAEIGSGTVVAPNAVIGPGTTLGHDCFVGPGAVVQNAVIGNRVVLHGGVQIGQDGFGYVPGRAAPEKVPQLGRVVIQDGVEIGANTTVDRGALDDTVIGENAKIDNLVQIAHNVRIGRNCLIASHTGISGSVTIGDNAMIGGQVGIADHVVIGANVQLAATSGVMHDIPPGERWGGSPALPFREWMRSVLAVKRLTSEGGRRKGDV